MPNHHFFLDCLHYYMTLSGLSTQCPENNFKKNKYLIREAGIGKWTGKLVFSHILCGKFCLCPLYIREIIIELIDFFNIISLPWFKVEVCWDLVGFVTSISIQLTSFATNILFYFSTNLFEIVI